MLIEPVFQQKVFPGPGKLKCSQVQRHICGSKVWTTVFNLSDGPQVVTSLWMAFYFGTKSRISPLRITFDGAAEPQIIGFTDEIFGGSFDHASTFRARFNGVTRNEPGAMSGYLRLPMPYLSSCKIEVYNNNTINGLCWAMVERFPLTFSVERIGLIPGMYLSTYGYGEAGHIGEFVEKTLFETVKPTILTGLFHYWYPSEPGNWDYFEGDYKLFYGGEGTPSYRSSGTEDFYFSSWGFHEGVFAEDDKILVAKDSASPYRCCCCRFFRISEAPYHSDGIKLTWTNGEAAAGNPGTVYIRWIVWYYQ